MPQFQVHFCQFRPDCKLFVLPSFEAYGELIDTVRDAMEFAKTHAYQSLRVYLCRVDFERFKVQKQLYWGESGQVVLSNGDWHNFMDIKVRVYDDNDTAQPGNAMMVIRKVKEPA